MELIRSDIAYWTNQPWSRIRMKRWDSPTRGTLPSIENFPGLIIISSHVECRSPQDYTSFFFKVLWRDKSGITNVGWMVGWYFYLTPGAAALLFGSMQTSTG
jgi:hypothetical protein